MLHCQMAKLGLGLELATGTGIGIGWESESTGPGIGMVAIGLELAPNRVKWTRVRELLFDIATPCSDTALPFSLTY